MTIMTSPPQSNNGTASTPAGGEVALTTPTLAAHFLTHNTHNRNNRARLIRRYAADMAAGEWKWTGEPIRFANDRACPECGNGTLLDGQHRLYAIIEAGVSIPLLIIRGLPVDAQEAIDTGQPRKLPDILKLRHEPNARALAALLSICTEYKMGLRRTLGHNSVPHSTKLRFLEEEPELRDILNPSRTIADMCGLPASIVGLVWWITAQIDPDDSDFFMKRLGDGQGLVKGDPIYELRRTVQENRNGRGDRDRTYLLAITIKAWNAYRKGEQVGLYRWRPGGAKPEKFPEPI